MKYARVTYTTVHNKSVVTQAKLRIEGEALLKNIEKEAVKEGKTLLILDTATGSDAQKLYTRLGWNEVGAIPNYALWPDGRSCSSTFFINIYFNISQNDYLKHI
ncbi:MAG: hypothetical protein H7329_14710 [Opitutaceae bacterium]|nr:hypothetical protein [Cytophagales bacterium]